MIRKTISTVVILSLAFLQLSAQHRFTEKSLFFRSDSLQVEEIMSENGNEYETVGHHGPAVENSHFALRMYFDDSGAVDLYSKNGRGMELLSYKWYPEKWQVEDHDAGGDEYMVGGTLGLGGVGLWDGHELVRLVATRGRKAVVGDTRDGVFAELIAYGVKYLGDEVDISMRIDMFEKTRVAVITARELNGKKVQFATGINFHEGQTVRDEDGYILVWGRHPADVTDAPGVIGSALSFGKKAFRQKEKTDDMFLLVTGPQTEMKTKVTAASPKEAELNSLKRFEEFVQRIH